MASNYTEHYQLPIWAPEDSFLREEFNESHQKIDAALAQCGNCRVISGSYRGTGTYGAQTPTALTFDRLPFLVFVSGQAMQFTAVWHSDHAVVANQLSSTSVLPITWGENSLSWYGYDGKSQFNVNNGLYHYIALIPTEHE